jgi:hypothetical protein
MKPPKLHAALLGGLFIGVVSALPIVSALNSCCCLWLVTGGLLAAYVMQQNHPAPIALGDGAAVGFLSGLAGMAVLVVVSQALSVFHVAGLEEGLRGISAPSDTGMSPEVSEMLRRMDPRLLAIVGGAIFVFVGLAASTVGGTIGAVLFRRAAPAPPPDMPAGWGPPASGWAPPPPLGPPVPPSPPDTVADAPVTGPSSPDRSDLDRPSSDSDRPGPDRPGPHDPPS